MDRFPGDMSVVAEFRDIFDKVPGLPLAREIELCIELFPGTSPIHRSPNIMSLTEKA